MSTQIDIPAETRAAASGKAPSIGAFNDEKGGPKKGIAIFDFLLRLGTVIAAVAAAVRMGTSEEDLPLFSQFFRFQAGYDDLPTFQFFVIAMGLVGGYLVLSLPFSIVAIIRPHAVAPRLLLLIMDTAALTLNAAAAGAAAAIVYLAHNGNPSTNWLAICQQYVDFCRDVSGGVVASFVSVVLFMLLISLSGFALRKN